MLNRQVRVMEQFESLPSTEYINIIFSMLKSFTVGNMQLLQELDILLIVFFMNKALKYYHYVMFCIRLYVDIVQCRK